jgi:hypothetical protein
MKKSFFVLLVGGITLLVFAGCKKDQASQDHADPLIAEAKKFFDEKVKHTSQTVDGVPNARQKLKKTPLWQQAQVREAGGTAIVFVPIQYQRPLTAQPVQAIADAPAEKVATHLAMVRNGPGSFITEVITYVPGAYMQDNNLDITACFIKEDWAGNSLGNYAQKNGNLYKLKRSDEASAGKAASSFGCVHIHWFLCSVNENGIPYDCVYQFTEAVGCDEGLEPPGDGGDCEVLDPETGVQVVSEYMSAEVNQIDTLKKYKRPRWRILKGVGWALFSTESGVVKHVNGVWVWESLEHVAIDMSGMVYGGSVSYTQGVGTPSFTPGTPNVRYAGMSLNFSVTYQVLNACPGASTLFPPKTKNYTSNAIFSAEP